MELIARDHSYQAGKHGGMCGLNAANPLDARTPPPLPSALSCSREGTKATPSAAKTALRAWACVVAGLGGCDKMRQAHQADWRGGDDLNTFYPCHVFPLHSNTSKAARSKAMQGK